MVISSSARVSAIASRYLTTLAPRVAVSTIASNVRLSSSSSSSHPTAIVNFFKDNNAIISSSHNNILAATTMTPRNITTSSLPPPTRRAFSDMMPRRAFPQYTSFGPEYAMGVRAVLPQFKRTGGDGVSVERRGKLLLDFIPRNNTGSGFAWNQKIFFSLTVEEVGLLLSQLPMNSVELSHPVFGPEGSGGGGSGEGDELGGRGGSSGVRQYAGDVIEKVLTIVPGEGGTMAFTIDFAKDGVPGQTPPGTEGMPNTPMKVVIQAGEFEIFKSIFQTSIPYLLGWNTSMDIASAAAISRGLMEGNNGNRH